MKTAHLRKKTWENSVLLPMTTFPTNWWPTQASPLWTAKPRLDVTSMGPLAHPLARLHLELRGKAKDVKCAVKKKNQRILMLTWGSHASQPILYSMTCTRRKSSSLIHSFSACPWIYLEGAPSKLRRAKCAVKLSTFADRLNFKHWPRHRQSSQIIGTHITLATSSRCKCKQCRRSQTFRFFRVFLI